MLAKLNEAGPCWGMLFSMPQETCSAAQSWKVHWIVQSIKTLHTRKLKIKQWMQKSSHVKSNLCLSIVPKALSGVNGSMWELALEWDIEGFKRFKFHDLDCSCFSSFSMFHQMPVWFYCSAHSTRKHGQREHGFKTQGHRWILRPITCNPLHRRKLFSWVLGCTFALTIFFEH